MIYDHVYENMIPNAEYKKLQKKFDEERKTFLQNMEEKNSQKLEELCDLIYSANSELNEEAFCVDFSL